MTAGQNDRVRSDNSTSGRHLTVIETGETASEHDPLTDQTGQYTTQSRGGMLRLDSVADGLVFEEFVDSVEWFIPSKTERVHQTDWTRSGLPVTHEKLSLGGQYD
ncbi:hypothetical protein [Halorubrum vacuolatum]|nr:hypothetical protein [Halorubrum vacuolatum]